MPGGLSDFIFGRGPLKDAAGRGGDKAPSAPSGAGSGDAKRNQEYADQQRAEKKKRDDEEAARSKSKGRSKNGRGGGKSR